MFVCISLVNSLIHTSHTYYVLKGIIGINIMMITIIEGMITNE